MIRGKLFRGPLVILVATLGAVLSGRASAQQAENPYTTGLDVRYGRDQFARHCSGCHGLGATGGETGPDLTSGFQHTSSDAGLFGVIADGIPNTQMSGMMLRLQTDQTVWQVVTYLRSITGGIRVEVPGDPARGAALFRGKGDCVSCHMIRGDGGRHGPNLSTIGSRRSPDELLSDLVEPDERVQPRWWRMNVTHRDGTHVEGLRMGEGTYAVRILDADDNLWSFEKRDLAESERIETSSMPSYADALNSDELRDLVAYVYGLTRGL